MPQSCLCPYCRNYQATYEREHEGQTIRCPKCWNVFQLAEVSVGEPVYEHHALPPIRVSLSELQPPPLLAPTYQLVPLPQPASEIIQAEMVAKPNPSASASANRLPYISPSQLQVPGETLVLFGTLSVALALFVFVSMSTAFLFAILFLVAYVSVSESQKRLQSSATRITRTNDPNLDVLLQMAAQRLTMPATHLYVLEQQELGAFARGFDGPGTVVLHSSMLKVMTRDEILFVLGHELTHLKCGHCRYLLFTHATVDSTLNQIASLFFHLVFRFWSRKSEFTCDRGGTIACKDPHAAMTALAKLENSDEIAAQAIVEAALRGVQGADDLFSTHPEIRSRIAAIWEYSRTPDFMYLSSSSN